MAAGRRARVVATAAVVVVVAAAAACSDGEDAPVPVPTIAVGPPPPAAPQPGPPVPQAVPVYYVAETESGPRLYREFHRITTADPATDAVLEMLAAPTGTDPDYRSHWPPGTGLAGPVTTADGTITVDLTGVGPAQVGTELAHLTVQQLVFTVQGALQSTDPVRLLVDGEPVEELWGAVGTAEPIERGDVYALRSLVQIDEPADGAEVAREVEVAGEAAVFEATVLWEVLRDGEVVESGFTSTSEGQRFAPYSFTVQLDRPGEYTVRVSEDDPSGGEGRPPLTDDKTITVTS